MPPVFLCAKPRGICADRSTKLKPERKNSRMWRLFSIILESTTRDAGNYRTHRASTHASMLCLPNPQRSLFAFGSAESMPEAGRPELEAPVGSGSSSCTGTSYSDLEASKGLLYWVDLSSVQSRDEHVGI